MSFEQCSQTSARETPNPASRSGIRGAEREGFEPSTSLTTRNGFRDRRIRPLCHLSERAQSTGAHAAEVFPASRTTGLCPVTCGENSGEGGIRTLDTGLYPCNALAGRRLQPLGHFSGTGMVSHPPAGKSPIGGMPRPCARPKMGLPVSPLTPRHLRRPFSAATGSGRFLFAGLRPQGLSGGMPKRGTWAP